MRVRDSARLRIFFFINFRSFAVSRLDLRDRRACAPPDLFLSMAVFYMILLYLARAFSRLWGRDLFRGPDCQIKKSKIGKTTKPLQDKDFGVGPSGDIGFTKKPSDTNGLWAVGQRHLH